jgi:hypothetical protein
VVLRSSFVFCGTAAFTTHCQRGNTDAGVLLARIGVLEYLVQ